MNGAGDRTVGLAVVGVHVSCIAHSCEIVYLRAYTRKDVKR